MASRLQGSKKILIIIGVVFLLLIFLNVLHGIKPINFVVGTILEYPLMLGNKIGVGVSSWWQNSQNDDLNVLKDENTEYKNIIEDLTLENSQLLLKIESLDVLDSQMAFIDEHQLTTVPARVISRPLDQNKKKIIINKGSKNGIEQGQAAIVNDGIMIGKITNVFFSTSEITLLVDQLSQITCQIQNEVDTPCIAKGSHGVSIELDLIPQTDEVSNDSFIITSGLEEQIPKGLFLGQIESIQENQGALFKQAQVKTLINFNYFDIVSIVTSQKSE